MAKMDVLLMRHSYDDHSYIDGLNDASLTTNGIEIAKNASRHYAPELERKCESGMVIRVSSKRRAVETAEILSEELARHAIKYSVDVDSDLCELYQGNMVGLEGKSHAERVRMLELGWEIFERERVAENYDYKYGTPDFSDSRYGEFDKFIEPPYGESQNELSARVEAGFINAVADALPTEQMPLFIVHRGTIREILNIAISHNAGSYGIIQNSHIDIAGWKYCEMFETALEDVNFSLGALARNVYGRKSA